MPTVAAYADVQDSQTVLTQPGDPNQTIATFSAAGALAQPRPILTFRVNPDISPGDINLTMRLNDQVVVNQDFRSEEARAWTEVVDANILQAGSNTLTAELHAAGTGGAGNAPAGSGVTVSDVSLLFPVSV
jgi:hypothetical protein